MRRGEHRFVADATLEQKPFFRDAEVPTFKVINKHAI
jgi:hypothetical protein